MKSSNEGQDGVNGATTARDASSFDITPMSHFDLSNGLPKCLRQNNMMLFNKQKDQLQLKSTFEADLFPESGVICINKFQESDHESNSQGKDNVQIRPSIINIVEKVGNDMMSQESSVESQGTCIRVMDNSLPKLQNETNYYQRKSSFEDSTKRENPSLVKSIGEH